MENKKRNIKISLHMSLSTSFILLLLITIIPLIFFSYQSSIKIIKKQIQERVESIVNTGSFLIDADVHNRIDINGEISNDDYEEIREAIVAIAKVNTDIELIYTVKKIGDDFYLIADLDKLESDDNSTGEIISFDSEEAKNEFNELLYVNQTGYADNDFYIDKWGTWLSGYAPVFNSDGTTAAILGIDIPVKRINEINKAYTKVLIIFSIAILILSIISGFVLAKKISKPLQQISNEMIKIGRFEMERGQPIKSIITEVMTMTKNLDVMKKGLRSFEKYLPSKLVKQLIKTGIEAEAGGEYKNMTIFFSDITDFTATSEKIDAKSLTLYLSEYFEMMYDVIEKHNGTIDKFIGDAVMAFWNAPEDNNNHPHDACKAAIECQQKIAELNNKWKSDDIDIQFNTRIGISTGKVIVGNIGANKRINYTIIGDTVNLTSRIEQINKQYGTSILVGEETYDQIKSKFNMRIIDKVAVKGKENAIFIYELISDVSQKATESEKKIIDNYKIAFDHYQKQDFESAIRIIIDKKMGLTNDDTSKLLMERCNSYLQNNPGKNWDGAFMMKSK